MHAWFLTGILNDHVTDIYIFVLYTCYMLYALRTSISISNFFDLALKRDRITVRYNE
jgi:hypothetical protein